MWHSSFYSCAVMHINEYCEWCGFHQNMLQTLFSTCSLCFDHCCDDPFCGCYTFISPVLKIPSFVSSQRAASWFIPNAVRSYIISAKTVPRRWLLDCPLNIFMGLAGHPPKMLNRFLLHQQWRRELSCPAFNAIITDSPAPQSLRSVCAGTGGHLSECHCFSRSEIGL